MPHDRDGKELKVGDIVHIPCRIKEIHLTEEYCNLNVRSLQKMFPSDNFSDFVINSRQCVKV